MGKWLRTQGCGDILISEIYKSIQGESTLVGLPTIFIRTFGCNLRCQYCDTKYAVNPNWGNAPRILQGKEPWISMSPPKIMWRVKELGPPYRVCLTGGEPLVQKDVYELLKLLMTPLGAFVSIETNGEVSLQRLDEEFRYWRSLGRIKVVMDVKCPGSGMETKHAEENLGWLTQLDEIKFVISNEEDYNFAKSWLSRLSFWPQGKVLFSPVVGEDGLEPSTLATWILQDGLDVRFQYQLHKVIWPGKSRGV